MREHPTVLVRVRLEAPTVGMGPAHEAGNAVELAADALWSQGACAVEVRDDPEGTTLLAGYPTPEAARTVARRLSRALGAQLEGVDDSSWREAWRSWMEPVPVGDHLLVVPSWKPVPVDSGRKLLRIDPGACFGSGTHASTRMILAWLDRNPPVGADVVDVGTGSGILAVAAAALGARRVTGLDIDVAAVAATEANAAANGVSSRVHASTDPLRSLPPAVADLVLVNVTAGTHAEAGHDCARILRDEGILVLSGLLPGQWQHVAAAYQGLRRIRPLRLDGWEGAVLARRARQELR